MKYQIKYYDEIKVGGGTIDIDNLSATEIIKKCNEINGFSKSLNWEKLVLDKKIDIAQFNSDIGSMISEPTICTEIIDPIQRKNCKVFYYYTEILNNITQDGDLLYYTSIHLQDNFDIVKAAVTQNGIALKYASHRLKDNFDIVKIAVTSDAYALKDASDNLRDNFDIVKAAITQNAEEASYYASERLLKDPDISKALHSANIY